MIKSQNLKHVTQNAGKIRRYTLHATRYTNRGFTLFIAVIVSSLFLAIGFSLASLSVKQQIISSIGKESQFAFYAADTGIECALYWDFKLGGENNAFATSTDSTDPNPPLPTDLPCNNQNIAATWSIEHLTDRATTTFAFNFLDPDPTKSNPYCAVVKVGKNGLVTTIESRGYNNASVSGSSCLSSNPRTVERAVRVSY